MKTWENLRMWVRMRRDALLRALGGLVLVATGVVLLALGGCAASAQQVERTGPVHCTFSEAADLRVDGGAGEVHIRCATDRLPTGHRLVLEGAAELELRVEVEDTDGKGVEVAPGLGD